MVIIILIINRSKIMFREALVTFEGDKAISKKSSEKRIQGPQQTRLKNIFNEEVSLVDFEKINNIIFFS